jgi:hypothetical protein
MLLVDAFAAPDIHKPKAHVPRDYGSTNNNQSGAQLDTTNNAIRICITTPNLLHTVQQSATPACLHMSHADVNSSTITSSINNARSTRDGDAAVARACDTSIIVAHTMLQNQLLRGRVWCVTRLQRVRGLRLFKTITEESAPSDHPIPHQPTGAS